jgi:hypothetical protein
MAGSTSFVSVHRPDSPQEPVLLVTTVTFFEDYEVDIESPFHSFFILFDQTYVHLVLIIIVGSGVKNVSS